MKVSVDPTKVGEDDDLVIEYTVVPQYVVEKAKKFRLKGEWSGSNEFVFNFVIPYS